MRFCYIWYEFTSGHNLGYLQHINEMGVLHIFSFSDNNLVTHNRSASLFFLTKAVFFKFSGFWNHQVECRVLFFRKRIRPLPPMSLEQAALHQKLLKRFIEWLQTLNWEMNSRKIHHLEGNHLNLQVMITATLEWPSI